SKTGADLKFFYVGFVQNLPAYASFLCSSKIAKKLRITFEKKIVNPWEIAQQFSVSSYQLVSEKKIPHTKSQSHKENNHRALREHRESFSAIVFTVNYLDQKNTRAFLTR
ncbi:MAG: hypothetical protein ACQETH_17485, partial [Candidatus Rifleibacteriota bacterium]